MIVLTPLFSLLRMLANVAAKQVRDVSFFIDFQSHVVSTHPIVAAAKKCVGWVARPERSEGRDCCALRGRRPTRGRGHPLSGEVIRQVLWATER